MDEHNRLRPVGGGFYWWARINYMDTKKGRMAQALEGYWRTEQEAYQNTCSRYSSVPGADIRIFKSRSRDRDVVRHEEQYAITDRGEATPPEALGMKFRRKPPNQEVQ